MNLDLNNMQNQPLDLSKTISDININTFDRF